jgi:dipeptidase
MVDHSKNRGNSTMEDRKTLVRRMAVLGVSLLVFVGAMSGQYRKDIEHDEGCTSITVGILATTDGSVIVCHTCDGNYRTWLNIVPHQTHPEGAVRQIYWGNLHTESLTDMRGKILKGEILQVAETYSYMNVAYPCMNEKQLAFGETTIMGKAELRNDEGLFLIEELQAIALERCTTAREAIRLMGDLATRYGYGDWGECLTVADTKEVWQFEIFGSGSVDIGAVWAAQRIPDDHVGVSANIPRISEIDPDDEDNFMASSNVFSLAEEMGWWDPNSGEPFKFWKAYGGKRPFSMREFFILSSFAPSLKLTMEAEELPFTVKPEAKVSVKDIMAMYRQTYEGTEYDVTKNLMVPPSRRRGAPPPAAEGTTETELIKSPVANPFMGRDMIRLFNSIKPGSVKGTRLIAIARCSYSQIIQLRGWLPDEVGGVAWFSFDNPAQSPRFPIFAGALNLPESFETCGQHKYRTDAAVWWFRRANRLATVAWGSTREHIESAVTDFEEKGLSDMPMIESRVKEMLKKDNSPEGHVAVRAYLTRYTNDAARAAMVKWWELGDQFWARFARGF